MGNMLAYLKYLWHATDAHGIHSPFVYALYTEAIAVEGRFYAFDSIDALREKLLRDLRSIKVYGQWDMVHALAKRIAMPPKEGQLLFKIANFMKAQNMLEIGSALGIGTLYQTAGRGNINMHTFEPDEAKANIAQEVIGAMGAKAHLHRSADIGGALAQMAHLDWVLLNECHSFKEMKGILIKCLEKSHEDTAFVFRNQTGNQAMSEAWQYFSQHPAIHITIDLYDLAIAFPRPKQPKQHFILKY